MKNSFVISSKTNQLFRDIKSLFDTSGIIKHNSCIVSGKKIVDELLPIKKNYQIVLSEDHLKINSINLNEMKKEHKLVFSQNLFNELDSNKTRYPLLKLALPEIKKWRHQNLKGCSLLIPFQNPINVGSVIRSAKAMGVSQIIMLPTAAHPFHPRAIRASSGVVFHMDIYQVAHVDELLNNAKQPIITLDMNGKDISKFSFPDDFMLLPGIEGEGLPTKLRKHSIAIPMEADVESLNASVSVSIVLWEWKRRLGQF